jgi:hypothetical protein
MQLQAVTQPGSRVNANSLVQLIVTLVLTAWCSLLSQL